MSRERDDRARTSARGRGAGVAGARGRGARGAGARATTTNHHRQRVAVFAPVALPSVRKETGASATTTTTTFASARTWGDDAREARESDGERETLRAAGATWGRTTRARDDDDDDARGVAREVVGAVRRYVDGDASARRRAGTTREDEDERYVGPSPAEDERGRGLGGAAGTARRGQRKGAEGYAPRVLARPREGGIGSDGTIPGMTPRRDEGAGADDGEDEDDDDASAEARAAYEDEIARVMAERARSRGETVRETRGGAKAAPPTASARREKFDPRAPPKILPSSALLAARNAPDESVSEKDARVVDTPGSDWLQSRGATAPMVLRRKPPPPVEDAESDERMDETESEDKARKKRGGRRVREREERRVLRSSKNDSDKTAASRMKNAPPPAANYNDWVGSQYGGGYGASVEGAVPAYGMAFADGSGLFPTFAAGYPAGYSGYYGYASAPPSATWTQDAASTASDASASAAASYPYQAPVTVPANAPFDINATGTYGAAAAVSHLAERLGDLPSSLGAEFGSTEDLSSVANAPVAGGGHPRVQRHASRASGSGGRKNRSRRAPKDARNGEI